MGEPWQTVASPQHRSPPGRWGHTCVVWGKYLVIFGGNTTSKATNDLFYFSLDTMTWTYANHRGDIPDGRWGHSAAIWRRDVMIIFGGVSRGDDCLQDTHFLHLDTCTWSKCISLGHIPEPRHSHTADIVGDRMFVFGGARKETQDFVYVDQVSILEPAKPQWTIAQTRGEKPNGRAAHSSVVVNHNIYIFMGFSGMCQTDIHKFDTKSFTWSKVTLSAGSELLNPTYSHTTCFIGGGAYSRVLMFGGISNTGHRLNELFVFCFDSENSLKLIKPPLQNKPTPRDGHTAVIYRDNLYIYSGRSDSAFLGYFNILPISNQVLCIPTPTTNRPRPLPRPQFSPVLSSTEQLNHHPAPIGPIHQNIDPYASRGRQTPPLPSQAPNPGRTLQQPSQLNPSPLMRNATTPSATMSSTSRTYTHHTPHSFHPAALNRMTPPTQYPQHTYPSMVRSPSAFVPHTCTFNNVDPFFIIRSEIVQKTNIVLKRGGSFNTVFSVDLSRLQTNDEVFLVLCDLQLSTGTRVNHYLNYQINRWLLSPRELSRIQKRHHKIIVPIPITQEIQVRNFVGIYVKPKCPNQEKFSWGICTGQRRTLQELFNRVPRLSYDKCKENVQKTFKKNEKNNNTDDDDDDGIEEVCVKLTLMCPITQTPIQTPCRSSLCGHLQFMDLENYLELNQQTHSWLCPTCAKVIPYESLFIDTYFEDVLKQVGPINDSDDDNDNDDDDNDNQNNNNNNNDNNNESRTEIQITSEGWSFPSNKKTDTLNSTTATTTDSVSSGSSSKISGSTSQQKKSNLNDKMKTESDKSILNKTDSSSINSRNAKKQPVVVDLTSDDEEDNENQNQQQQQQYQYQYQYQQQYNYYSNNQDVNTNNINDNNLNNNNNNNNNNTNLTNLNSMNEQYAKHVPYFPNQLTPSQQKSHLSNIPSSSSPSSTEINPHNNNNSNNNNNNNNNSAPILSLSDSDNNAKNLRPREISANDSQNTTLSECRYHEEDDEEFEPVDISDISDLTGETENDSITDNKISSNSNRYSNNHSDKNSNDNNNNNNNDNNNNNEEEEQDDNENNEDTNPTDFNFEDPSINTGFVFAGQNNNIVETCVFNLNEGFDEENEKQPPKKKRKTQ